MWSSKVTQGTMHVRIALPTSTPQYSDSLYHLEDKDEISRMCGATWMSEVCSVARPFAEVTARNSGLAPIARGEVDTASPPVAVLIAMLTLPVTFL
jgi:hypothetical protein